MRESSNLESSFGAIASSTGPTAATRRLRHYSGGPPVFQFRHIPEFDGFRGFAVLVVVIGHYLEFRSPTPSPYFAALDELGVLLFFVLSGFLITGLLPWWRRLRDLPMSAIVPTLIAATSYHIIEKPILRLKDRLAPQA